MTFSRLREEIGWESEDMIWSRSKVILDVLSEQGHGTLTQLAACTMRHDSAVNAIIKIPI